VRVRRYPDLTVAIRLSYGQDADKFAAQVTQIRGPTSIVDAAEPRVAGAIVSADAA
jgi:hypothetical protein